ncbi:hypothetical protein [Marinobacter sp. CHS3-4]|uniref:hypothetical protein n=1 Tax=Marinobacter sp. CHS3-4 TaxID=3045174 RepID=UPI0024B4E92F|nr:hypothetical protein [Marinobacter sp. CHS3-4]MDI9243594.1 hypothetical protein [Marinobacter sp. CHS3-4]
MNRYTRTFSSVFLALVLTACSSSESDENGGEYIQSYIDAQLGFDYAALMETIENQRQELLHQASIASRVNREMDLLLRDPAGHSKLKEYVDGLSEEEKSAPTEMVRIANQMKGPMAKAFEAFSAQMAVMTVTEEICGKPRAAEKWQDLFIRVTSKLNEKLSQASLEKAERNYLRQLDSTAKAYESGTYKPSCSAQLENTEFLYFSELVLNEI